uniref:ATP synthase complex subunit 8 n=1 Tax=Culiseta inconspicua TaxID=1806175 RepID=A0A7T0CPP6_9DIPT|nr:ATP synthase F0 subunit 8 [Culiseta inconspicua]QPJ78685.1 ATP synthase F0 subunit 8 [Culiseta inconspicua]
MPQMAPISWLTLFLIFSLTLVIFNIKNYFCFFYNSNQTPQNMNIKSHKMNWKW